MNRTVAFVITGVLGLVSLGQSHAQRAPTPTIDVNKSDKVLFAQATNAMMLSRYAVARTLLTTLIVNHPDSVYVPNAKLSIADAWYAEGDFKQAKMEYLDLITFFPNRPEATEALRKIASLKQ